MSTSPAAESVAMLEAPEPLAPPEPVTAVRPAEAVKRAEAVKPERQAKLSAMVTAYADQLVGLDPDTSAFTEAADDVRSMGDKEIRESASTSSKLLDLSMKEMDTTAGSAQLPKTITALRRKMDDLNPSQAFGRKFLGMIPFGDAIVDYMRKFESTRDQLDAILGALQDGKDALLRDNAELRTERVSLWEAMSRLREFIYIAEALDAELEARVGELAATDPAKARKLSDEVLFYVRQKHSDLLVQLAASQQSYLTMGLLLKNNVELVKGVDRISTTGMTALRNAAVAAVALERQRRVLEQVKAMNETTEALMVHTSEMLREQSSEISAQAGTSTISLEALSTSFENVYAALDEMDTYKTAALTSMRVTIDSLRTVVAKGDKYLDEPASQREGLQAGALGLPA